MTPSWVLLPHLALGPGQLRHDDVVNPADYTPCGLNSFYLVCRMLDAPVEWQRAKELLGDAGPDGMHSFQDIARAGEAVGLHPVGLRATAARLADLPMPAIVHVRDPRRADSPPHLLVLVRANEQEVVLLDPPAPAYSLPADEFANVYTGNVLFFAPTAEEAVRIRRGAWATLAAPVALTAAVVLGAAAVGTIAFRRRRAGRTHRSEEAEGELPARRRPFAVACGVVLVLVGAAGVAYAVFPGKRVPRCVVLEPEIDLGELDPGTFQTRIPVRNEGSAPLVLQAVSSSCTCAKALSPDAVEPGETGMIDLDQNVSRGPQRAVLTVHSNDPAGEKKVVVWWHGRSRPVLHPVQLVSTTPSDRPYVKTLQVIYPGGMKALRPRLEKVECDSPHVSVREGENRPVASREYRGQAERAFGELDLHVRVTPPGPNARVNATCQVTIRQGGQSYQLGFVVSVHFLGGEVTPEAGGVIFSAASREGLVGQTRTLRVSARPSAKEVEVSGLPDWLTCENRIEEGNRRLRLKVTRPPDSSFAVHTVYLSRKGRPASTIPIPICAVTP